MTEGRMTDAEYARWRAEEAKRRAEHSVERSAELTRLHNEHRAHGGSLLDWFAILDTWKKAKR